MTVILATHCSIVSTLNSTSFEAWAAWIAHLSRSIRWLLQKHKVLQEVHHERAEIFAATLGDQPRTIGLLGLIWAAPPLRIRHTFLAVLSHLYDGEAPLGEREDTHRKTIGLAWYPLSVIPWAALDAASSAEGPWRDDLRYGACKHPSCSSRSAQETRATRTLTDHHHHHPRDQLKGWLSATPWCYRYALHSTRLEHWRLVSEVKLDIRPTHRLQGSVPASLDQLKRQLDKTYIWLRTITQDLFLSITGLVHKQLVRQNWKTLRYTV